MRYKNIKLDCHMCKQPHVVPVPSVCLYVNNVDARLSCYMFTCPTHDALVVDTCVGQQLFLFMLMDGLPTYEVDWASASAITNIIEGWVDHWSMFGEDSPIEQALLVEYVMDPYFDEDLIYNGEDLDNEGGE